MSKIKDKIEDLKYRKKILEKELKKKKREDKRQVLFDRIRACSYDKLFIVRNPDILFIINEITDEKILDVPEDVKTKIDYSNVSFEKAYIKGVNFSGMQNVRINPQLLSKQDMRDTILNGVLITGSLDDVYITRADFTGSSGAFLYPTRAYNKDLRGTNLTDVIVVNDFKDVLVENTIIDREMLLKADTTVELESILYDIKSNQKIKK